MDDLLLLGEWKSPPDPSATKATYFEGLFKEDGYHENVALPLVLGGLVAMFFFWPLILFSVLGGLMLCLPRGPSTFRPGYAGRCPVCRGQVRFEVSERKSKCLTCDTPMVRIDEEIHALK